MTRRALLQLGAAGISAAGSKQLVLLDHDGGFPDDYLAAALLLTMEQVTTVGIVVTPADGYLEPAVSATRKILNLMGRGSVPLGASRIEGAHPFPPQWRQGSNVMDQMAVLNGRNPTRVIQPAEMGPRFVARLLRSAAEPVTVLVTGPLSTLAAALRIAPAIEQKIRQIVWMGGALNVPGNVETYPTAEWNAYWDPAAVASVWRTRIPIVMCPLDITNQLPVTKQFVGRLRAQARFPLSRLAADSYGKGLANEKLYFWDVLTASYVAQPDLFQLRDWETVIVGEGQTKVQRGGRRVKAMDRVDVNGFYGYLLGQWGR